jgi:GR25 family glycosyltransferase involved in LPS biosynthesis
MKVFVLHYSKLTERKANILAQFEKHKITDFEFIELFDKDEISEIYNKRFENLYKSEVSIYLKHQHVFRNIADNYDYALVLEDDVILSDGFMTILEDYMKQLPADYDMLFMGDGCKLHMEKKQIRPDTHVYKKCLEPTRWGGNGATRSMDSYLITKDCARRIAEEYESTETKIRLPIGWWLNDVARKHTFKVYWAEPTIVTQGSQNGTFNRVIQNSRIVIPK